ncbi:MAG: DNA repair protein RecO [Rhodothermaceae bacterium]|nr:DNA repair protein RecO [Rhodothermaceae bacterium]
MGQIFRTEAIVLRNMDYRETSQIVTLFTKEKGKLTVLAKGARQAKSQFGSTLQPMSHIQAVVYHKPTRDIQTLGETSHLSLFTGLGAGLEKLAIGLQVVEMIYAVAQVEEENEPLFRLLLETLYCLDQEEEHIENIWPFFQIQLASTLGFQPYIQKSDVESITQEYGYLALETGAVHAQIITGVQARKASRSALRGFAVLAKTNLETVMRMHMSEQVHHEVSVLVDSYLRYHLEEALPTRSDKVIAQLFNKKDG